MFALPELPYDAAALEPVISRKTLSFHHDKHHRAYIDTTNILIAEAGVAAVALEQVVRDSAREPGSKKLFNNAAQAWNHSFFWLSMTPTRVLPDVALNAAIQSTFGGLENFKAAFVKEGAGHFGSGWVWLAAESAALKLISTHDADDVLLHKGLTPLLVCDIWEHAYYLDHQNNRQGFLEAWVENLPNWTFAGQQFAASRHGTSPWKHPAPQS